MIGIGLYSGVLHILSDRQKAKLLPVCDSKRAKSCPLEGKLSSE